MKKTLVILAALLAVTSVSASPARSLDQGSMGLIGPKDTSKTKTHIAKDFPPIPGVYPVVAGAHPFSGFRPFGCASYNYCNRHTFQAAIPDGYIDTLGDDIVSYGIKVTLTWPDPKGNDVDLFVWPDDDEALGGPQGPCSHPPAEECEKTHPEFFSIVEPRPEDDEGTEDVDESKLPVEFYISVVNDSGVNTGYTLDLQWFLIPFGSFPDFQGPEAGEISQQTSPVSASRTPQPFDPGAASDADSAADDDGDTKILIPGPDGKLIEQDLDFFAAGHRFKQEKTGTASWVYGVTAGSIALAVGLFAYFVWQRRRREALA